MCRSWSISGRSGAARAGWWRRCSTSSPTSSTGKLKVAKLNVDENQELAMQFRVSSIPAFVLFKDGQVVDRTVGAMPKSAFKSFLSQHLA